MKKNQILVTGALVLAAVLFVTACPSPTTGGGGGGGGPVVSGVAVSPATASVAKGGTQTFTAAVTGTGNPPQTVTWTLTGGGAGTTISAEGVLTVAAAETAASLTVRAASTADPAKTGAAVVAVSDVTATVDTVAVSPAPAIAAKGGTAAFTATVTGTGNPAQTVTWTVTGGGAGTTISAAGLLTVAAAETAASLTVTAASTADPTKTGAATVTVLPYTDMAPATPDAVTAVTITGNSAYGGAFPAGRTVTLSPFSIAKYETTYELWYTVRRWAINNGYTFANAGREGHNGTEGAAPTASAKWEPVTTINWRDAVIWCNAYSEQSGKEPVYYTDSAYTTVLKTSTNAIGTSTAADRAAMKTTANGYRLPTEAEWEYAARGGGTPAATGSFAYRWAGTDDESGLGSYAWYSSNSGNATHPVGEKAANGAGLYDMSGNVYEWCWDWYVDIGTGTVTNPAGPTSGTGRVPRGGGLDDDASDCAVATRIGVFPGILSIDLGFRLVMRP